MNAGRIVQHELIEPRTQRFTLSEVQKITNNFSSVIGKGGFGTVFHGSIGENQVAVKMLSESSAQGYREFQAEVSSILIIKALQYNKNISRTLRIVLEIQKIYIISRKKS